MRKFVCVIFLLLIMSSGFAVVAQRPDAPVFAERGPYPVGTREYTIEDVERPLNVTVWYPAEDGVEETVIYRFGLLSEDGKAARDAAPNVVDAPYPLVVFSHGNGGFRYQSLFLMEHLASYGFVVIALDHPQNTILDALGDDNEDNIISSLGHRPADITRVIDYAESFELANIVDTARTAVTGHSLGGYTALVSGGYALNTSRLATWCDSNPDANGTACFPLDNLDAMAEAYGLQEVPDDVWPLEPDPRIQAVVALAPWNGVTFDADYLMTNTIPTMLLVGSGDSVTPPQRDASNIYSSLHVANPKALVTFQNAGHYIFVDSCNAMAISLGLFEMCSDPVWDMARVHDLINHLAAAFLRSILYEDIQASEALQPELVDFQGVDYQYIDTVAEDLTVEVLSVRPHDTTAYTQGLLLYDGLLYESTGQYGESSLREVDPETGEVLRRVDINEEFFSEGLAKVDDRLIMLTWRENTAAVFDFETFEVINAFTYPTEGWGLCYDGESLYMTDGSAFLYERDPNTFELLRQTEVTLRGEPVYRLNELECVGNDIYANIYLTDTIVRIDKASGIVEAQIDASGLLTDEEYAALSSGQVLNGIAYDAENDVFLITGKDWPKLFEVRFVPPDSE